MIERIHTERGNAAVAIVVLLLVFCVGCPLLLHFWQKSHNRLPFEISETYPPGQPFVNGEIFASTVIAIMERELSGIVGWRPNDFVLWGPKVLADNNASRQLGIIKTIRESVRVLRDHLTKVSAKEYDPNLRDAENQFRIDATSFWFPSAEGAYRDGIEKLEKYVEGLQTEPPQSSPINRRNVELIRLFQAWTDLLGNAHANLYRQRGEAEQNSPVGTVSWMQTDNSFYEAQGHAHVMYHLIQAVRREYAIELEERPTLKELFTEVTDALDRATHLKPLVIMDGSPAGLFANHRRNLDVFIVDARQKMYSIREELEK